MSDAPSPARKTLKVVLWIVVGIAGLCFLCCGGVLMVWREETGIAWRTGWFAKDLQDEFGAGTQMHMQQTNGGPFVLAVGIPGFDPAHATEDQDKVWRLYAQRYAGGALPIQRVAVGKPGRGGSANVSWDPEHEVDVEELARRTGVPVPPIAKIKGLEEGALDEDENEGEGAPGDGEAGGTPPK